MTYDPRSSDDIRKASVETLQSLLDDPATNDKDVIGAILTAVSETISEQQEQTLRRLDRDSYLDTATGEELTRKAREYGIVRREPVRATGVVEFQRDTDASTDYLIPSGTRIRTADGSVTFETTETRTLAQGTQSVRANVRAVDGGVEGNLPAGRLVRLPSQPSGVESVTNPKPTGDADKVDRSGDTLIPGLDRETDDELRQRVFDSNSIGGAATVGAIRTALLDIDGVQTATVFINATDATDADGLDPYSSEVVVTGGNEGEIARTLRDTVSVTELLRLQSGKIGNSVTRSVYVEALDKSVSVGFSRPVKVDLSIDLTVVTDSTYIGDDELKDRMVEYIGGTKVGGTATSGLGGSEDVIVDRLEDSIVDEETGVVGISNLTIDATGDGTDDRTTNADGIEVISIAREEQALLDAANVTVSTA